MRVVCIGAVASILWGFNVGGGSVAIGFSGTAFAMANVLIGSALSACMRRRLWSLAFNIRPMQR